MHTASLHLCVASLVLTGCHCGEPAKETLLIAGNAALVRYLDPVVKEFQSRNSRVSVVAEPGGTTAAVIALKRGAIDIAALSRLPTAEEDDVRLRDYQLCRDGIAVILNPANPVGDLSKKQLEEIFTAELTSWRQVGGPDREIHIYVRDKGAHTSRSFSELALDGDEPFAGAKVMRSSSDMVEAVQKDPEGIGFVSLRHVGKDVKVAHIDGVEMTRLTMLSGRYPLSRTFYLGLFGGPSQLSEEFIRFALSPPGQELLAADGQLPVH